MLEDSSESRIRYLLPLFLDTLSGLEILHSSYCQRLHFAVDIFHQCGADGWVEKYEEELARL